MSGKLRGCVVRGHVVNVFVFSSCVRVCVHGTLVVRGRMARGGRAASRVDVCILRC